MVFFVSCIVLVTVYTCLRYIRLYTSVLQNNLSLYSIQVSNSIDEVYNTCHSIAYSLSYNGLVQSYLTAETPLEKYEEYSQAYSQMTGMMELSSYIKDIALISAYGNTIAVYGAQEAYADYLGGGAAFRQFPYFTGTGHCKSDGLPASCHDHLPAG